MRTTAHHARLLALLLVAALARPALGQTNRFASTLLKGRVTTGALLYGQRPSVASAALQPWRISSTAHPNAGAAASARIVAFDSPSMKNAQGKPRIDGPGDTVRFEATVSWDGQGQPPFGVALHTNANTPENPTGFQDYSMQLVGRSGNQLRYAVDLPVYSAGTYEAKAVVVKDSCALSWSGGGNYVFRPYFREFDRINEKLVHVANLGTRKYGTFEDMIGEETVPNRQGKYTLGWMKSQGNTAVRLLPFKTHGGGPYSATSFFDVCVEHSATALQIRDQIATFKAQNRTMDDGKRAQLTELERSMYRAALGSLRSFVDAAHKSGLRVFVDYIGNHTGTDVRMLDIFFKDSTGRPMDLFDLTRTASTFEVRANDPTQIATGSSQLATIFRRMEDTAARGKPLSLQKVTPHLYGKYGTNTGAAHEGEIADGGWFEWPKFPRDGSPGTWQLNHGCQRNGYCWYDQPESPETLSTRRYVLRDMAFLVLMGVDGFRLDHLTGMPQAFLDRDLNLLQGVANRYRPGVQLFHNGEDFHRGAVTEPRTDALERGGFRVLLGAQGPEQFRAAVDASWRQASMLDVGNHDEGGAINKLGGNSLALARVMALNCTLGGPSSSKMLDECAEARPIDHHNLAHKAWGLFNSTNEMRWSAGVCGQAGRAKCQLPALWERQHDWLQQTNGAWHQDLLVAARYRDRNDGQLAVVASNFHGLTATAGTFGLTDGAKARLNDGAMYHVYNYMADPNRPVWSQPVPGWKLKREGLYVGLKPNETQVLDIREVRWSGSGWAAVGRNASTLHTIGYALEF
jgi:hypothetical protein